MTSRIERVEVLYHFLGNEERMSYFPEDVKPFFVLPEGHDGIDLRAYEVFSEDFGLGGRALAVQLQKRRPRSILLYTCTAFSGDWHKGIVLPKGFDSGRVVFYKTLKQREAEAKEESAKRSIALCNQVFRQFPHVFVRRAEAGDGVIISPKLNVCSKSWRIHACSIKDVEAAIKENELTWSEWEDRTARIYADHGLVVGCVPAEVIFADESSPNCSRLVAVDFYRKTAGQIVLDNRGEIVSDRGQIVLRREGGEWKLWGVVIAYDAVNNISNLLKDETKLSRFIRDAKNIHG